MTNEAHGGPSTADTFTGDTLLDAEFPELPGYHRYKVRDSYRLPDGRRLLISTDRQSAFDHVLAAVPYKGQVLTQTARYWAVEKGLILVDTKYEFGVDRDGTIVVADEIHTPDSRASERSQAS